MPDIREKARPEGPKTADGHAREQQNAEREATGEFIVDSNGAPVVVPVETESETPLEKDVGDAARDQQPAVEMATPASWWRIGLIALAIVVVLIALLQLMTGGQVAPTGADQSPAATETVPAPAPAN